MSKKAMRQSDEYITYRVILAFIEAAVCLFLMSKLFAAIDTPTTYSNGRAVCLIIAAVGAACALFGMLSYIISVRRNTHRAGRVFNGMFLSAAGLILCVCALLLFWNHTLAMRFIYMFVPACALLFFIYCVYPKQFFVTSTTHAYVLLAFYMMYKMSSAGYRLFALLSGLAVCLIAVLVYLATVKSDGCVKLFGVRFVVFGSRVSRRYILLLYGATALCLVAVYLLGGGLYALIGMIVTLVYIVCSIIYGTVKMM